MRKLGFDEIWIDLIYRHISNNWYSIILNGTRNGFFKSNRGLRQRDPLSLALFVISAEHLSILFINLSLNANYTGYYKPIKGPSITHLAFTSGKPGDLRKVLNVLTMYENVSGHLINKNKSCVALAPKAYIELIHIMVHITGMHRKEWSIKIVLIKHVLLAMPMHLLAAMKPPKGTFEQIEGAIARFLWNGNDNMKKYHWCKWEKMCLPFEEGGVGFRCLRDTSKAFIAKSGGT
ncbi:uncharacterized protein LOC132032165 [Lycium ferocissimum]|uniref:uncharacterized protein LOC132032165 n=1 Tax=Lycium ferocissimum TaxID=112874 RepID=UPI002814FABD|nr:uncharacterized protein LOC132032165 [Lycium ferocissimum]